MVWEFYSCVGTFRGLGNIGGSLPNSHPKPPQYRMWDCLVMIVETFMLKSHGIHQIFLSAAPLFLVLLLSTHCQKSYIAPRWHVKLFGLPLGNLFQNLGFLL